MAEAVAKYGEERGLLGNSIFPSSLVPEDSKMTLCLTWNTDGCPLQEDTGEGAVGEGGAQLFTYCV